MTFSIREEINSNWRRLHRLPGGKKLFSWLEHSSRLPAALKQPSKNIAQASRG